MRSPTGTSTYKTLGTDNITAANLYLDGLARFARGFHGEFERKLAEISIPSSFATPAEQGEDVLPHCR